jgi:transcriptional regulator with XRE-family HTH domain
MVKVLELGGVVEQLEQTLGLSDQDFAQALGINLRTVERWRDGTSYPQHEAREKLRALTALTEQLTETFSDADAVRAWVHASSRYLAGLAPAEVLRVGRIDRVAAALEALNSGFFV